MKDGFAVIAFNVVCQAKFDQVSNIEQDYKVVNITEAGVLNGMASLNGHDGVVVVSDSLYKLVWCIDTRAKTYDIVLQDVSMIPKTGRRSLIEINGVKVWQDHV